MTETVIGYIFMFFFFSAIGWTVESTYRSIGERKKINSGFLHGPVCPIYGTGALVFEVFLVPFSLPFEKRWWVVLLAGVVLADTVEYLTSFIMEKLFHARWWDYTGNFLNINGRICFKHSCYWAVAAGIYCYIISPLYAALSGFIPKNVIFIAVCVILAVFAVDLVLTVKAAVKVQNIISKLDEIRDALVLGKDMLIAGSEVLRDTAENKVDEIRQSAEEIKKSAEEQFSEITSEIEENYREITATLARFRAGEMRGATEHETRRLFGSYPALRERVNTLVHRIENDIAPAGEDADENGTVNEEDSENTTENKNEQEKQ